MQISDLEYLETPSNSGVKGGFYKSMNDLDLNINNTLNLDINLELKPTVIAAVQVAIANFDSEAKTYLKIEA